MNNIGSGYVVMVVVAGAGASLVSPTQTIEY